MHMEKIKNIKNQKKENQKKENQKKEKLKEKLKELEQNLKNKSRMWRFPHKNKIYSIIKVI